jgi:transcriptional regulatory protein RtcR
VDEQAMLLKAIEEKQFFPVGSDREVASDFQLIAGTNRDLRADVAAGKFREDLFARVNLWTYELPGLAQRPEDIEPNLDYLLAQFSAELGQMTRFTKEARAAYLNFSVSPAAQWAGNFRDLSASVMRMATLAEGGRITNAIVDAEMARLRASWQPQTVAQTPALEQLVQAEKLEQLDLFDRLQLESVIQVCRQSANLSDAGRKLFAASRTVRSSTNDADRLRKYLARFGVEWKAISD